MLQCSNNNMNKHRNERPGTRDQTQRDRTLLRFLMPVFVLQMLAVEFPSINLELMIGWT